MPHYQTKDTIEFSFQFPPGCQQFNVRAVLYEKHEGHLFVKLGIVCPPDPFLKNGQNELWYENGLLQALNTLVSEECRRAETAFRNNDTPTKIYDAGRGTRFVPEPGDIFEEAATVDYICVRSPQENNAYIQDVWAGLKKRFEAINRRPEIISDAAERSLNEYFDKTREDFSNAGDILDDLACFEADPQKTKISETVIPLSKNKFLEFFFKSLISALERYSDTEEAIQETEKLFAKKLIALHVQSTDSPPPSGMAARLEQQKKQSLTGAEWMLVCEEMAFSVTSGPGAFLCSDKTTLCNLLFDDKVRWCLSHRQGGSASCVFYPN